MRRRLDTEGNSHCRPGDARRPFRQWPARSIVVLLLVAVGAATCSAAPKPQPDDDPASERPIRPDQTSDRKEFEDALEELEAGNFEEARRAFRLLNAEQTDDAAVAQLAELYVARASLGALASEDGAEETGGERPPEKAVRMFASLQSDASVDGRVRRAARLYWAYLQLRHGARGRAVSAMADIPDGNLGSAVLDRDRGLLWPVLVEGLHGNGRWNETLRAAAGYYGWLEGRRAESDSDGESRPTSGASGDSDASSADSDTDSESESGPWGEQFDYARSRGFEAAFELSAEELEDWVESDDAFLRATAGWAYVDQKLESEKLSEEERTAIDERFQEVATDLNAIGAADRVSELSVKLATLGGSKRLVLGAVLPLSGSDRSVGRRAVAGMLIAMEAFEHRGSARVTLVFEDALGAPEKTMRRLDDLGASAVVGPLDRKRASKFAPVADRLEIPMIAMTADQPRVDEGSEPPFVLRNFMNPVEEARAVATLAFHEYEDRRAAVAYPDIGYGRRVKEAFAEEFEERGGQVVSAVSYDPSASDYSRAASKIARSDPDAVFIPDGASNVAEFTAFLADQDVWGYSGESGGRRSDRTYVHYLGTSLWRDSILTRQASRYLRGATIPAWYAPGFQDDATQRFGRRFRGVHGRNPSNIEAFGYDNVRWLRRLMLERGLQDPRAIRDALLTGGEYRGATGQASFTSDGRLRRRFRFVTVEDESFRPMSLQVELADDRSEGEQTDDAAPSPNSD